VSWTEEEAVPRMRQGKSGEDWQLKSQDAVEHSSTGVHDRKWSFVFPECQCKNLFHLTVLFHGDHLYPDTSTMVDQRPGSQHQWADTNLAVEILYVFWWFVQ